MAVWIAHRPGGPRADRYFLRGQTLTADGFARAEINTGLLAQQVLGTEALAGAYAETTALTELLAQLQRNATPAIEALGSTILDAKTLAGWLAYQVRDGIAAAESAAIQQKGANASTESLSNAPGDAFDPVAFSATQIGNTRDPLENLGANSVLGEEFAPLEALAGPRSNSRPLAEALPTQSGDADFAMEALAGHRADALLLIEALARALRDWNMPLESAGSAALVCDHFLTREFLAAQRTGPQIPTTWLTSILCDGRAPIEIIATTAGGTIKSDALAIIELLAWHASDALVSSEGVATARRDTMIQDEVLAKVKRDASPQIETLGQATTCIEAFLTIEAGFELAIANVFTSESLISAADTSFAVLGSWITPLLQIAVGRLLKSPGKVRILTIWKK